MASCYIGELLLYVKMLYDKLLYGKMLLRRVVMKIVQAYESWKLGNSWFLGITPDRLESLYPASNFD